MSYHQTIDIIRAILACRPNAKCSVYDNDYEQINWQDERPKPSLQELEAVWNIIKKDIEFEYVRSKRTGLLAESDYTQLPDYKKGDKEAWAKYRQELRDLPNKYDSVSDVVWPSKPN